MVNLQQVEYTSTSQPVLRIRDAKACRRSMRDSRDETISGSVQVTSYSYTVPVSVW
jgi:hypothetical protein